MTEATTNPGVSRQTVLQCVKRGELYAVLVRQGGLRASESEQLLSRRSFFNNQGAVWNMIQVFGQISVHYIGVAFAD